MEPDWDDFKILGALAQGGSVAAAARLLGVDNSTVSRRLGALEAALEAQLVVRTGRELSWTAEGRLALAAAGRVAQEASDLARAIKAEKRGYAGTVKVSCTPATVVWLSVIVERARNRFPGLVVELSGLLATADLAKGEADLALRAFKPASAELIARRGVDVGWYLVASSSYATKHGLPQSEAEIEKHPLVLYDGALQKIAGPRWLEERRGRCERTLRFDSPDAVAAAIASGAGLGVVPNPTVHGRDPFVRVLPEPVAWGNLFIVYRQSDRDSARVRAVVDLLVEHFEVESSCYTGKAAGPFVR